MFAGEAFAQTPFATISGAFFITTTDESFTLSDTYASSAAFGGATADSISFTDTQPAIFNFVGTDAPNFSLADVYTGNVGYATYVTESVTLTDSQAGAWGTNATVEESTTLTDELTVNVAFAGTVAEVTTIVESLVGGFGFYVTVEDTVTLTTTQTGPASFNPTVLDAISLADALQANAVFNPAVTEAIVFTDSECAIGWIKIQNNEDPNWGRATPITIVEVHNFGGFTFGGVPMAGSITVQELSSYPLGNTPTVIWTDATTPEDPGWGSINNDQQC